MLRDSSIAVEKALVAERHVAIIRAAIVAFNTLAYVALLEPVPGRHALAVALIAVSMLYTGFVVLAQPYRRWPALASAYATTVADAALITLWLYATGGVDSPFLVLWYVSLVAVAFRFDARATMIAAVVYVACYVGLAVVTGEARTHVADLVIRSGYIVITALFAALTSVEGVRLLEMRRAMKASLDEARAAERAIRELIEAAPDAFVLTDRDRRVTLVNARAERLFGWRRDELLGASVDLLLPNVPSVDLAAGSASAALEIQARRKDGSTFPAEVTQGIVETGSAISTTLAVRDTTERRRLQMERKRSEENLRELNRFREIDAVKTQFLNTAAHELGTPLTPIRIQLHMLKSARAGDLNNEQSRAIGILDRNVDRLATLVSDMLDAAKVQSQRLQINSQSIRVDDLVRESVESFTDAAAEAGVELAFEAEPGLLAEVDAPRLTKVLFNYLSNAIRFTPRGGSVNVRASSSGDDVLVTVRDTGIGLRPEDVGKLFKPFSQLHDTSAETRAGTGLGLYISRGIVEQHGGEVWCASDGPGRGSTFGFRVPKRRAGKPQ